MRVWVAVLLAWLCGVRARGKQARARHRQRCVSAHRRLAEGAGRREELRGLAARKGLLGHVRYDLGFDDMEAVVGEFVEKIEPGDTAVFV